MASVATSAAMNINAHYLNQVLGIFWETVKEENWGLYAENGEDEIEDTVLMRMLLPKLNKLTPCPDIQEPKTIDKDEQAVAKQDDDDDDDDDQVSNPDLISPKTIKKLEKEHSIVIPTLPNHINYFQEKCCRGLKRQCGLFVPCSTHVKEGDFCTACKKANKMDTMNIGLRLKAPVGEFHKTEINIGTVVAKKIISENIEATQDQIEAAVNATIDKVFTALEVDYTESEDPFVKFHSTFDYADFHKKYYKKAVKALEKKNEKKQKKAAEESDKSETESVGSDESNNPTEGLEHVANGTWTAEESNDE